MLKKLLVVGAVIIAGGLAATWWLRAPPEPGAQVASNGPRVSSRHGAADRVAPTSPDKVIVPELSQVAKSGKLAFDATCSACHGINAAGTDMGPPLIHNLYRPGHHPDGAFASAAANGVTSHHWRFGNMPPISGGVSDAKMRWIVKYIREMQEANGVR